MAFIEVAEARAARDAMYYRGQTETIPSALLSDESEAWYQLLPADFENRAGHDPKASMSAFLLERSEQTEELETVRRFAQSIGASEEVAEIAQRIAARTAVSRYCVQLSGAIYLLETGWMDLGHRQKVPLLIMMKTPLIPFIVYCWVRRDCRMHLVLTLNIWLMLTAVGFIILNLEFTHKPSTRLSLRHT